MMIVGYGVPNKVKIVSWKNVILIYRTFIIYSGITKIYYRKTLGHVFTKPVQIEGTTQFFSPQ